MIVYINDIFDIIPESVVCKLYADDLKIYTTGPSDLDTESNNESVLQNCLDSIQKWASDWQLQISVKKCYHSHTGRVLVKAVPEHGTFYINNDIVQFSETVSDLGVLVDCELKFTAHINKITSRALNRANLIHKCFLSKDASTLVKAFKIYVRPVLEYCSPVWSPRLIKDIQRIEAVQRRFTKRIPGMERVKYSDRLRFLGLETLDTRRLKADLILAYKILFGLVNVDIRKYFEFAKLPSTRGHQYKLFVHRWKNSTRQHFFASRVVPVWNNLPNSVEFSSLKKFKLSIETVDLSKYCREIYS